MPPVYAQGHAWTNSQELWQVLQKPGRAVALAVGGAEESLLSCPRTLDLVLRKRQGFVRIAVQAGWNQGTAVHSFAQKLKYLCDCSCCCSLAAVGLYFVKNQHFGVTTCAPISLSISVTYLHAKIRPWVWLLDTGYCGNFNVMVRHWVMPKHWWQGPWSRFHCMQVLSWYQCWSLGRMMCGMHATSRKASCTNYKRLSNGALKLFYDIQCILWAVKTNLSCLHGEANMMPSCRLAAASN